MQCIVRGDNTQSVSSMDTYLLLSLSDPVLALPFLSASYNDVYDQDQAAPTNTYEITATCVHQH